MTLNPSSSKDAPADLSPFQAWGLSYRLGVCEKCDWLILVPIHQAESSSPAEPVCPHCFGARLSPVEQDPALRSRLRPPELWIPFSLPGANLQQALERFSNGIRFAPADLTIDHLHSRLQRIYLPVWLVDCQVQATWQAEMGANYQVVSHQDRFDENRGGWTSREIEETRVRWEPRVGRLDRSYQNISASALQAYAKMVQKIGNFDFSKAQAYSSEKAFGSIPAGRSFVRLPDRSQVDAWPDVMPRLQQAAQDECRRAASGDHIREFNWKPEFRAQNWTLLLMPAYTTYYVDDDGVPHTLFVHGQNGRLTGLRRASMKRAQKTSLWIAVSGLLVFLVSLLLSAGAALYPALLAVGGIGLFIALLILLGACIPLVMVWSTNRSLPESEDIP